ncbi:MAG TPA: fused MFS/spermidine synthase [Firmicutes bacterium]|jgi:spermidine synthase|nr:fused MFS/spermidine synthase [Bacillota bacterium]
MRTIVFVSGAVLMSLEMLGSRILAPYFGNSIFVWGSLISVFLAALTLGYSIGGSVADKKPYLRMLALILAIPGFCIVLLPLVMGPINRFIAGLDLGSRLGPLITAVVLFFIPSVFMGMVSPFAIKLKVKGLDTVGNTAGSLYAVSTLGSIAGTLGTSFFLITWIGVRKILYLLGAIMLVAAALVWLFAQKQESQPQDTAQGPRKGGKKKGKKGKGAVMLLLLVAIVGGQAQAGTLGSNADTIVYEKDSLYHHISVVDSGGLRFLKFDASWQSAMSLTKPLELIFPYTEYFHLGMLLRPEAKEVLMVGLGGGSVPKNFRVNYPGVAMDAADIDPEVIRVAKTYFMVKEDDMLRLIARDGRIYLHQTKKKYDLLFFDAYFADAIPFHLATQEYLREVFNALTPDGVVVANIIGAFTGPKSRFFRSIYKTYTTVFPYVYAFSVGDFIGGIPNDEPQNIILIAVKGDKAPDWQALQAKANEMTATMRLPSNLPKMLETRISMDIQTHDVPVLTDDYAPVDYLIAF